MIINIWRPGGDIIFARHFGIWFPITTYVIFWEGGKYLKIYQKIFNMVLDMDILIGLASHIVYIFSIAMAIYHFDSPMYSYPQLWEVAGVLIVVTKIGHALEKSQMKTYKFKVMFLRYFWHLLQ